MDGMERSPLLRPSSSNKSKLPAKILSYRYALVIWAFLGFINLYFQRVNLSVALVAMVNHTGSGNNGSGNDEDQACPLPADWNQTTDDANGEFDWDETIQSNVLGAFFYGYIVAQIPGGIIAEKYGGKWPLGLGILCTSVLSLFLPLAARVSWKLLMAIRIIQGLGEGMTTPGTYYMLGQWAPPLERTIMATVTMSGSHLGNIIGLPLAALLSKSDFLGGWPSVFYVYGLLGVLWFIGWSLACFDSPDKHPRITEAERKYINDSLGNNKNKRVPPTPWKAILTSVPVWVLTFTHFSFNWIFYSLLTETPSYLSDILHFKISENGLISALPYVLQWSSVVGGGLFADALRRRWCSTRFVRRLFNTVGMIFQMGCLLGIAFVECRKDLAVVLIALTGLSGFSLSGFLSNHLDLAPDYAGPLMGLTNCAGTIPGFLGPIAVGLFTSPKPTVRGWQQFFFLSSGICGAGLLAFLTLGAGEIQPWAVNVEQKKRINEEEEEDPNPI